MVGCRSKLPRLSGFLCVCLAAVSATDGDCSSASSASCADPTTLLQSRVEVDQQQEEEQAAAADIQVALSTHENMNPPHFLIMSSASQGKVLWTMRQNQFSMDSQSTAKAHTLIGYGLKQPRGLAFDEKNGLLYIADSALEKIFRYTLVIDKADQAKPQLATTHVRLTIVQGCGPVEWLTLDDEGNLFYSAPRTNNINKISANVMSELGTGELQASSLTIISEKALEAHESAAKAKALKARADALPTDPPSVLPHIQSIYEAKVNSHVAHPGAIWVDGPKLYWTNQADGTKAGTVVQGQVNPKAGNSSKTGPAPFPAEALTNVSSGAIGLAKTKNVVFFTRNETAPGGGMTVSGLVLGSDIVIDFMKGLAGARALAWDKEETMYVADEVNGQVFSFPTGRVMSNAPRSLVVSLPGAYGLAVTSSADPWFNANTVIEK